MGINDTTPPNVKEWTALINESLDLELNRLLNDYKMSKEDFLAISIKVFSEYKKTFGIRRLDNKD